MNALPLKPATSSSGSYCLSRSGGVRLAVAFSISMASGFVLNGPAAFAQSLESNGEQRPTSILLRGTTGSGEQDAVFTDNDRIDSEDSDTDLGNIAVPTRRDTSDPVRQLQGRARPVQPEPPVLDPEVIGTPTANSNIKAAKSQDGTGALAQTDPFAAVGFRMGTWQVFSSVEQTVGYSTNIDGVAQGKSGAFSQTDVDVSLQSDWSRHSARIDANGSFLTPLGSDGQDIPSAGVTAGLNLDVIDGVSIDLGALYNYTTESVTSTNITSSAASRPGVHTTGASLGVARTGQKLSYALRGSVTRSDYEAIELTSGASESQGDRNNTLYTLNGRVGYEISPAISPFIEGELSLRDYDRDLDRNGEDRHSIIMGARAGVAIDLGEKLSGEIAVGYRAEDFADPALETLDGITLDGNVVWSPMRDTTLTLTTRTDFSSSTTAGQNGSVVFDRNGPIPLLKDFGNDRLLHSKTIRSASSLNAPKGKTCHKTSMSLL